MRMGISLRRSLHVFAGFFLLAFCGFAADSFHERFPESKLEPLMYNHPGLVVDLGVGLWGIPLPCDFDGDGDNDLLVACAGVPSNGVYFFENTSGEIFPVFKPGVWLCPAGRNPTIHYGETGWELQDEARRFPGFAKRDFTTEERIDYMPTFHLGRDKQWKRYDYDGDGATDLVIGASDWREYGWDDAYNEKGEWTRGPLHGYVYFVKNLGNNDAPKWAEAVQIEANGKPVDVFGCPSPNLADWDGDGDLDLMCGEFLDKITYFENIGTRTAPRYAEGRFLADENGPLRMELEMLQVVAFDWDKDGDPDLVVGQEDGRVAWLECKSMAPGRLPVFAQPRFFRQEADRVKVGALCTPVSVDWDGDGDEDLVVGDTAGYLNVVENLDGRNPPQWAAPVQLSAAGKTIRIQAGQNGSIQGPAEAKWGYTVPEVADWDRDGFLDILVNSIWGKVQWYRNPGKSGTRDLEEARPIEVEWDGPAPKPSWLWWTPEGKTLVTQWRTSPRVRDFNGDGLGDLAMLDTEGRLALFERQRREGQLVLLPPKHIFLDEQDQPLRLNEKRVGKSGRRKFTFADWDGDGRLDILLDGKNIDFLRNVGDQARPYRFQNQGPVDPCALAGHDTCPAVTDWDRDGRLDLLIGAEDGFFYRLRTPIPMPVETHESAVVR